MSSIYGTVHVDDFYVGVDETVSGHKVELRTLNTCISPLRQVTMEQSEIKL
jgi:hypothetical protein